VFQKNGSSLKEGFVSKTTTGDARCGTWRSRRRAVLYVPTVTTEGMDPRPQLAQHDRRFGDGAYPGHFYGVGSVAVDSKGNVYTGETYEGKRVQNS